ncbi:hypothetical protein KAU92_03660, partial [Candidatus Bathyarchaeota archaeon]|nr:hypothetical protein [Candidatus Bathyarchaeota archaeon]
RDVELLNSNNVLSSFVDYFPKVFKSDYVTVYGVPLLNPPSPEASVAVLNLSPSLQKSEDTTWIDDSFAEGWFPYRQYGEVKSYEFEVRDGIAEISVTSNQSGNVWISYSLPLALKTDDSTISFRYRVDNDHTWFTIQLRNASNHVFFHEGRLTHKVFTTKHYPLPDGQVVSRAEIIIETTNEAPSGTVAMAEIDCIEISSSLFSKPDVFPSLFISLLHSKYSLFYVDNALMEKLGSYISNYTNLMLPSDPPNPIGPLINWVTEGNTLTVFNTHGNGFFAKLLELNDSSSIFLTKELGAGEILYINCFPSIKAGNQSTLIQPNLIEEVKENSAMNEYIHRVNVLPVYNSTLNAIEVKGNLTIYTDVLMLEGSIHLTDSPFSSNNFSEIKMYGRVNLTIGNANLLIFPLESYMLIKPVSHFVEGKVLVSGPETSIVADTNITYSRNVPVSVRFNASNLSLYARLPSICAEGTITIDELDVHSALYIPLAGIVQQKAEIQGKVNFSTMYISGPLMLFSKFQAKGRILELGEMTSRPTIPWAQVFMSPYNLIFNTCFILGTALYAFQKRKRSHKNQHLSDGESTNKHLE